MTWWKAQFEEAYRYYCLKNKQRYICNNETQKCLPQKSLMTISQPFSRPLIDYGDIIYDQPQNESFCIKIESKQYKSTLAISGAIQGTSRDKIYQELGLESLRSQEDGISV